jgi:predicted GNAT family acetyltransferase
VEDHDGCGECGVLPRRQKRYSESSVSSPIREAALEDDPAREQQLDETIEESFPASDPPANTVETGIRSGGASLAGAVVDNREAHRFELAVDGKTATLAYERTPTSLVLVHTQVPPSLRGRHIADTLAKAGVESARAQGLQVVAKCHFVRAYLRKHREPG